jgi:hypothetical protein
MLKALYLYRGGFNLFHLFTNNFALFNGMDWFIVFNFSPYF